MHADFRTLVFSLSRLAEWYFEVGEAPPISGATVDATGQLELVTPRGRGSSFPGLEELEDVLRESAETDSIRACASLLEVAVRDPAGEVKRALRISAETREGEAVDVFVPCDPDATGKVRPNRQRVYSLPRAPRLFPDELPLEVSEPITTGPVPREDPVARVDPQALLLSATAEGDLEAMERALIGGAQVDEPVHEQTAVEVALDVVEPEALDWLLTHGASVPKLGIRDWQELSRPERRPVLEVLDEWGHRAPGWLRAMQGLARGDVELRRPRRQSTGPWSAVRARVQPPR